MSEASDRQRAVWSLWLTRGVGYGGLLLALLGSHFYFTGPGFSTLGITLVVVGLAIGVPGTLRGKRLWRQQGAGAAHWGAGATGFSLGCVIVFAAAFVVVVLLSWLLPSHIWPGPHDTRSPHKAVCLSNVKWLSLALQMYLADNSDVFPAAGVWCDVLEEYTANEEKFQCPDAPDLRCAYAFNESLDRASMRDHFDPVTTVAIFESDMGWNAAGDARHLPAAPRHLGGDNYGFADGHAQWIPREDLSLGQTDIHWSLDGEE
jgi:prepilin-type processing-associated H-X9-DG protein